MCISDGASKLRCSCPVYCPSTKDLVCGTNGVTYPSTCHLTKEACETKNGVKLSYMGKCYGRFLRRIWDRTNSYVGC